MYSPVYVDTSFLLCYRSHTILLSQLRSLGIVSQFLSNGSESFTEESCSGSKSLSSLKQPEIAADDTLSLQAARPALASLPVNAPPSHPNTKHSPKSATTAAAKPAAANSKRTLSDSGLALDDEDDDEEDNPGIDSNDSLEGAIMDKDCNQTRNMIRNFLDNGEMRIGQFCAAIGVSDNSYRTFMGQSGPSKGAGSDTYYNAWAFFKKREMKGIPPPKKQRKANNASAKGKGSGENGGGKKSGSGAHPDISGVVLEGEDEDSICVYDTCDEIRRKINAYMRRDSVTATGFCRELHAQYHTSKAPSRIQSGQLSSFRSKKGPKEGNTSSVFYAAYVFFEKLRIQEGKPKSAHRKEMEEAWPDGFDMERDHGMYVCS